MSSYNKYIFDGKNRVLIRDFEAAYSNCEDVYPSQFDIDDPKFALATDAIRAKGPKAKLLDIGSGYGAYVNYLQQQKVDAIGIEISESAIAQGKKLYGDELKLKAGDLAAGLDLPAQNFDVIVCYGVITWLLDKADICLVELKRLLKPGGMLAISMGHKDSNVFFREVVSSDRDFVELIARHFTVKQFFVHYHEIGTGKNKAQNFEIAGQSRDLIAFASYD